MEQAEAVWEGSLSVGDSDSARLLVDIFSQLEYLMKKDFKQIYPDELFYL